MLKKLIGPGPERKVVRPPSPPLELPPDRIIISNSDWLLMQSRVRSCIKDGIRAIKESHVDGGIKHTPITVYPTCMIALEDRALPGEVYGETRIESLADEKFKLEWRDTRVFYDDDFSD